MRLIVGISGASGVILGYYMLKALRQIPNVETHAIITEGAALNFSCETNLTLEEVMAQADIVHANTNLGATISSGSFKTDGMIIIPCSMKSLSGIANGYADNLLNRAADVCLKENRKIVVVPREMPFSRVHLKNMSQLAEYGVSIIPPLLTFYNNSNSVEKQIQHIIGKVLMQFGIDYKEFVPWEGM